MRNIFLKLRNTSFLVLALSTMAISSPAQAILISQLTDFTNGGGFFGTVTIEDQSADTIRVTADIADPINLGLTQGDILGLWFNVNDPTVLAGMSTAMEAPSGIITDFIALEDSVTSVGSNNNDLSGGGNTLGAFDIGVALGTQGGQQGFIQTLSFNLISAGLSEATFAGELVGMRVQSINSPTFGMGASSKLVTSTPPTDVPLPGTLALLGIGLIGLGVARTKHAGNNNK